MAHVGRSEGNCGGMNVVPSESLHLAPCAHLEGRDVDSHCITAELLCYVQCCATIAAPQVNQLQHSTAQHSTARQGTACSSTAQRRLLGA
jgi:hypothetical protein